MTSNTEWRGDIVKALINANAPAALNHGAELLRAASVPLAPLDRGPLRESAQVTQATQANMTAHVSYDTPYAVRQHEELDYRHDEGQAKYLEQPLNSEASKIQAAIANRLGNGLK